jgi:hypothetical protein
MRSGLLLTAPSGSGKSANSEVGGWRDGDVIIEDTVGWPPTDEDWWNVEWFNFFVNTTDYFVIAAYLRRPENYRTIVAAALTIPKELIDWLPVNIVVITPTPDLLYAHHRLRQIKGVTLQPILSMDEVRHEIHVFKEMAKRAKLRLIDGYHADEIFSGEKELIWNGGNLQIKEATTRRKDADS